MKAEDRWAKVAITVAALGLIMLRMVFPDLEIDAVTLVLLILAVLPWLSSIIKSAQFPGGWSVEFRDLQEAAERVTAGRPKIAMAPETPFLEIAATDPNLALVGLRIEIEKRLREVARRWAMPADGPLTRLLRDLDKAGALNPSVLGGLQELILAGNRAAHGAEVDPRAVSFALDYGPGVLAALDQELEG